MFTQREMDTAITEAKVETQKLLREWMEDYLGSRLDAIDTRGDEAEGASAQAAEGANSAQEEGQAY